MVLLILINDRETGVLMYRVMKGIMFCIRLIDRISCNGSCCLSGMRCFISGKALETHCDPDTCQAKRHLPRCHANSNTLTAESPTRRSQIDCLIYVSRRREADIWKDLDIIIHSRLFRS